MKSLVTQRQKQLLQIIYDFIKNTGFPPTFEEMREKLKVSSNQSVIDLLEKLEQGGAVKRNEGSARSININPLGFKILGKQIFPVVGTSAAGAFMESFTDVDFKWMEIPSSMVPNEKIKQSDEVFIIKVSGDSMINAGINNEDMLLVRKAKEFKSGDIVVARNSDGTTVKRFIVDGGKRYLKPENPSYQNISIIPDEIFFEGKVILNLSRIS
ncbi:repressor LexA [Candidatus Nomurabacteria bacterium RIFCSPHIGHO2_01_FULL_39_220]|uniref:Repressor LexA n=1 Tax=Candidatus Nomurabacteria bacterium RIFCSPLOWO2_02_FULL_40_67 TaxID=1801787 RepID=A0A1F6Y611_9BACT|nr:MAG: LexA repressor [Parcubacteria group bacterium GW2011_GWA2_40_37]KKS16254.1 MAG: LexA repressor [Parcubacteria group bacterium GW2011_GWB1_41_6]KKS73274.1 MAG: LexA repressor [Parcubacteria group bacterium GW2011_GWF2_42_7]OGI63234.1 MAG: repressor LexA [Candidatus Nomurabacteria bacterium RBG_16_40_11]OGI70761.1 MAG: repressor LexA [Candidatus Nomurabacteria bacterium RIFCSPHIGHO2_01_FULL_39_220]OGI73558.1 MAG: repressor LexA [Candidatus Nomurabacteria bacterium RIFCSPHIGHO2_02_41_18]